MNNFTDSPLCPWCTTQSSHFSSSTWSIALKCLFDPSDLISLPHLSLVCPLRLSDLLDLFVTGVKTALVQSRSFLCIDPSLWNRFPLRLASPSSLLVFLRFSFTSDPAFPLGVSCTRSASNNRLVQWEALHKMVKYNTIQFDSRKV